MLGESFFTPVAVNFTQAAVFAGKSISMPFAAVSGRGFSSSILLPSLKVSVPPVI